MKLNHQKLAVYNCSRQFAFECYKLTKHLPADEKFGMITQIRRAALSVYLNIAEGCSRKSFSERKRFFEIASGSVIEIDAVLEIANDLGYLKEIPMNELEEKMVNCFKMLCGLMNP